MGQVTPDELDEFTTRRDTLVAGVFERMSFRPGAELRWGGYTIEVFDAEVPDRDSGVAVPMCWDDQDLGEKVSAKVADPTVSDTDLVDFAVLCAAKAAARNDVHELCEFFCVDGARVFDPHPHGRRYDDAPVEVDVFGPGEPLPAWGDYRFDSASLVEVPDRVVSRVASELAERVTAGPLGRFEVFGTQMSHVGVYPDRASAESREFHWTREWACDLVVADVGNIAAATRSALVTSMFMLAAESLIHEVAEWLTVDGARPFDPHPAGCFQADVLRSRVRPGTSALVPVTPPR